jgi:preprotein translocase subunit SecE
VALYNWRQQKTRQLIEEVASELSKVTWPNKEEVMNSTTVVIFTTLFATVFFALMDRFWGFLTNLVYGT